MGDCALEMHEITAGYGSKPLFSGFSAELKTGKITSLVGLSGCGKSTLLRIAAGLQSPKRGNVVAHTQNHSMVFQQDALLSWRTALDNVALPLELQRRSDAKEKAYQALQEVGLGEDASKKPREMSGGMRMRCALARALVTQPELLFLDEAFSALDALTRKQIYGLFLDLYERRPFSALLVTHDLDEAVFLSDEVWVLKGPGAQECSVFAVEQTRPRSWNWKHTEGFGSIVASIEKAL
jgi:ABC-type nitrate/sulfonate/bicarbonate transport system ATPase subunit